jgi:hypothetical protein
MGAFRGEYAIALAYTDARNGELKASVLFMASCTLHFIMYFQFR